MKIVCGDTKVVEKGKGDGIFINTSGIGVLEHPLRPESIEPGDKIIVSGTVGDHGMAVMASRKSLNFSASISSDCASLNGMIEKVLDENLLGC